MSGFTRHPPYPYRSKPPTGPARPAAWMEQLTATLWSTGQTDRFRAAAESYAAFLAQANPARRVPPSAGLSSDRPRPRHPAHPAPLPQAPPLRHPLHPGRPRGRPPNPARRRRQRALTEAPLRTGIDGGSRLPPPPNLTQISYASLAAPRTELLRKTEAVIASGTSGPEALRSFPCAPPACRDRPRLPQSRPRPLPALPAHRRLRHPDLRHHLRPVGRPRVPPPRPARNPRPPLRPPPGPPADEPDALRQQPALTGPQLDPAGLPHRRRAWPPSTPGSTPAVSPARTR